MPPVSEKQRRLVHARAAQGEKWAKEWASKDPGGKLPEESPTVEKAARGYSEPGRGGPEAEMREGDWEPPVAKDRKFTKPVGVYTDGKKKGEDKYKVRMLKRSEAILELTRVAAELAQQIETLEKGFGHIGLFNPSLGGGYAPPEPPPKPVKPPDRGFIDTPGVREVAAHHLGLRTEARLAAIHARLASKRAAHQKVIDRTPGSPAYNRQYNQGRQQAKAIRAAAIAPKEPLQRSEAILELAKAVVEMGEALDKAEKKRNVLKQVKAHPVYKQKRQEGHPEGAAIYYAVKAIMKEKK